MSKKIVRWKDGQIVIRSGTVQDDINAQMIEASLLRAFPPDKQGLYRQFSLLCTHTESSNGLPWKPEYMVGANSEALKIAYEHFERMSEDIRDNWRNASLAANSAGATIEDYVEEEEGEEKK